MLDIRELRENGEAVKAKLARRGVDFDLTGFQALDARRKEADISAQDLQAKRNASAKEVGKISQSEMREVRTF